MGSGGLFWEPKGCPVSWSRDLWQDIPDVEGDRVYGILSLSVRVGQKRVSQPHSRAALLSRHGTWQQWHCTAAAKHRSSTSQQWWYAAVTRCCVPLKQSGHCVAVAQ